MYSNSQLPSLRAGLDLPAFKTSTLASPRNSAPPHAPSPRQPKAPMGFPHHRSPQPPFGRAAPPSTATLYTNAVGRRTLPPRPPHRNPLQPHTHAVPAALHGVLQRMRQHPNNAYFPSGAPSHSMATSPAQHSSGLSSSSPAVYPTPLPQSHHRIPIQPYAPSTPHLHRAPASARAQTAIASTAMPGPFIPFHAKSPQVSRSHPLFPYWCESCNRHFRSQGELEEHTAKHQRCTWPNCTYICLSMERMQQHIDLHVVCDGFSSIDTKKYVEQRRKQFPTRSTPIPKRPPTVEETQVLVQRSMAVLEGTLKRKQLPGKPANAPRRGIHVKFENSDDEEDEELESDAAAERQSGTTHTGSPSHKRQRLNDEPGDEEENNNENEGEEEGEDDLLLAVLRLLVQSDFLEQPLPRQPEPKVSANLFEADLAMLTRLLQPPPSPSPSPRPGDSLRSLRKETEFLLLRMKAADAESPADADAESPADADAESPADADASDPIPSVEGESALDANGEPCEA